MKTMPTDDYETPIEEFPGHIGHELDQMLFFDWLSPRDEALWSEYIDLLVDEDMERTVVVSAGGEQLLVRIQPDRWLGPVLDQLPSFEVW